MNYKQIVAEAWQFTQENKKLTIWFGAFPAFFGTVVGIGWLIYQYYAFLSSKLFQNWNKSFLFLVFSTVLDFLQSNRGIIVPLLITAIVLVACYFFVPVICQGGLIQLIARRRNGQAVPARKGFSFGLMYFLPLFEYSLFFQIVSGTSIYTVLATSLRGFGWKVLPLVTPVFILASLAVFFIAIFLTYTEFYIVIDEEKVFTSIAKSFNLVVRNLEETILLTILMLLIGIRIIIQLLFVMLIPAVVVGVVYLMALANLPNLGLLLGGILGLAGLAIASYLNGIIHVFAVAVWTFTFLKLTSEVKPHARDKSE
jgi:hypothetical protein